MKMNYSPPSNASASAFDRYYHGGRKPADAMALAIADALHLKQDHVDGLMKYRDDYGRLVAALQMLMRYVEAEESAQQVTGWESRAGADAAHARALIASLILP